MKTNRSDVVSASEIASWAWCPESWRLGALGTEPGNRADLIRGEAFHERTARTEVSSRRAVLLGWCLLAVSLAVAGLWFAYFRVEG